ncbi:hypothetical protein HELRODRAFT_154960 [Helobdella robusta]|uniref:TGF-beta family profile domain-containing protein n=1 Tax=Helobdella robusta TaxID=6412 RepID=T1ELG7_HELRO|nr:hypothetical protein HELRODRAFT_154960 [Helobdella robusta]ESO00383.1 hypothetical protein HELRODRAFT_154960 [Helobdella robusta]
MKTFTCLAIIFNGLFAIIISGQNLQVGLSDVRTSRASASNKSTIFARKKLFGIGSNPSYSPYTKVPQYMLDLHKQYNTRLRLGKNKKRAKSSSHFVGNTIRGFMTNTSTRKTYPYLSRSNTFNHQSVDVVFRITSMSDDEIFNGAELRFLYHYHSEDTNITSLITNVMKNCRTLNFLYIFHRIKTGNDVLMEYKMLEPNFSGWISVDVSNIIKYNTSDQVLHFKIILKTAIDIRKAQSSSAKHCVTKNDATQKLTYKMNVIHHPFLVTYSDDINFIHKRKSYSHRYKRNRHSVILHQAKRCNLQSMYVHFVDFSWHDWIIAPNGYEAKFCQGNCPSFMSDYFNATNHAHVQSMLHSKNKKLVPPPCCVPVEYDELPLLYVDENGIVVLKGYPNMIVKACGCR